MRYPPTRFQHVYLTGTGSFLPGEAVNNEQMDDYIAPINAQSLKIKRRILDDNGIKTRYYAIDVEGNPRYSAAQMGVEAVRQGLGHAGSTVGDVTLLAVATSGGDVLMPGFGNMLQGELQAPPMEVRNHHGICAAGIAALKDAAQTLEIGAHRHAVVATVEYPSRLFKRSRFEPAGYQIDFNAHFLRWMLSDGAGAAVLARHPDTEQAFALKLDWIHTKSFSGDFPVCMQLGMADNHDAMSFMDYASFSEAEANGALALRQDIRLLPQLFEVGIHEYADLVRHGWLKPDNVDHFLCHYSSEKLGRVCEGLMDRAGLSIPREKWFSNLSTCGNTGSASIYIMLAEFFRNKALKAGERIFCFVPESGRFTVSYMMLTVVEARTPLVESDDSEAHRSDVPPPHEPGQKQDDATLRSLLQQLATVWHDYRSRAWRTPLVKSIQAGTFTTAGYLRWMESWIPQVREGSLWMRKAIGNVSARHAGLGAIIEQHAGEEQDDFLILFADYQAAGGTAPSIEAMRRNPGGEALNSYMHRLAEQQDPLGLLGAIYIIEGTGRRIIPALLPRLRQQLSLRDDCFRFLRYHGENDISHLDRWLSAVELVLHSDPQATERVEMAIVKTARHVAELYLMQWEEAV